MRGARTYRILNSKGHVVRRNRRHLLTCKDKFRIQNDRHDHTGAASFNSTTTQTKDLFNSISIY